MNSKIILSTSSDRPMYGQIMDQIKQLIAMSGLKPRDELPSIRALAADLAVSVITVKRAYLELEREGVIQTQQGRGSFVAADPNLDQRLREEELENCLQRALELWRSMGRGPKELADQLARMDARRQEENHE